MQKQKIDEISAKILKTLLQESRTSFTKIAKDCKISVGAVRMRYKRLWKEGIVKGEITLVNPHSLGYQYISDLGIITAVENEKEVIKFLLRKPYISHMAGPLGKYNIWAKVALHDTQDLTGILEDIETNPHIKRVDALIWVDAANIEHPENLVINPLNANDKQKPNNIEQKPNQRIPINNAKKTRIKIDETDRKIAVILSQNSRTSFRKIAQQLDISTKTIIQRYKKLRENVLTRATITVDLNKLGYSAIAHLFVKAENRSKLPEIHTRLLQIPNLIVAIKLIGAYDLYASVVLADFQEFFNVNAQIRRINNIEKTDVFLTPNVPAWPLHLFPSLLESEVMRPQIAFEKA